LRTESPLSLPELAPEIEGRYRDVESLGRGAFAQAYRCRDSQTGNLVVLKVYDLKQRSWSVLKAFEREAAVLEALAHPAIPSYVEHQHLPDGRFMLVQSYVPGTSLASRLAAGERLTDAQIIDLAEQVLSILVYLQSLNPPIIHRDIKPGNLVIDDSHRVHLVDFGSVKDTLRQDPDGGSTVTGTYGYMAPEQFQGRAVVQSDLYGLGATLVHALSHVPPSELPMDGLKLCFHDSVHVSDTMAAWLDRMLEPDPRHRFANAREALEALRRRDATPAPQPRKSAAVVMDTPPAGSGIVAGADAEGLRLVLPGPGFSGGSFGVAMFATIWLLFVAIWTLTAAEGPVVFALFSIPFWMAGLGMMFTALFTMFGKTTIDIGSEQYSLRKLLFGAGRTYVGETADLHGAAEGEGNVYVNGRPIHHCVLYAGARELTFGSALSKSEREWVVARINRHLGTQAPDAPNALA
jgi:hypothetical protein